MAGASRSAKTNRPSDNDDQKKLARLRDQRLAAQAVREAAGTWGEISVGEITHVPTSAVFVHCWKGRQEPDLTKIHEARGQDRTPDEHQRMTVWLLQYRSKGFEHTLLGWNLSVAEANRMKLARIAELIASGRRVVNEDAAATRTPAVA
jgi:hypothetical protein